MIAHTHTHIYIYYLSVYIYMYTVYYIENNGEIVFTQLSPAPYDLQLARPAQRPWRHELVPALWV